MTESFRISVALVKSFTCIFQNLNPCVQLVLVPDFSYTFLPHFGHVLSYGHSIDLTEVCLFNYNTSIKQNVLYNM